MCGFLSAFSREILNEYDIKKFKKASDLIIHRGPDNTSQIMDKSYFSIFHRLSIRDLSPLSKQPLETKCRRFIICFNGEIYNIDELNSLFPESKDLKSDTLILSFLISKLGIDAINLIRGMFAITIYDKTKRKIYLVRDPFGIKPIYYLKTSNNKCLVVASEIKALLSIIENLQPDIDQCLRFLMMGVSHDTEDTFFKSIKSVPKGHILEVKSNLDMKFIKLKNNLDYINLSSSKALDVDKHNKFLTKNIKEHLVSDVPVATTISGGVDSSLVSSIVNKFAVKSKMFTAYSDIFDSEISEKREKEFGNKLSKINCTLIDASNYIDSIIKRLSSPFESSSWIYQDILMSQISSRFKFKVLLVGEGADEIYSGYKRLFYPYLFSLENNKDKKLFNESLYGFQDFLGIDEKHIEKNYKSFLDKLFLKTDYEDQYYSKYLNTNGFPYERYYPSKAQIQSSNPEIIFKKHLLSYLNRADIPSTLYILDTLSMSYSLELRVPFLDIKLFEEVMSYSFKYFFNSGFNKYILRNSSFSLSDDVRWNKVKRQRPTAICSLVYETLRIDIINLLSKEHILIDTSSLKNDFYLAYEKKDIKFARFIFKVYTFLKFWYFYF